MELLPFLVVAFFVFIGLLITLSSHLQEENPLSSLDQFPSLLRESIVAEVGQDAWDKALKLEKNFQFLPPEVYEQISALTNDPKAVAAKIAFGLTVLGQGLNRSVADVGQQEAVLRLSLMFDANGPFAHAALVLNYVGRGRYAEARESARHALRIRNEMLTEYDEVRQRGLIAAEQGDMPIDEDPDAEYYYNEMLTGRVNLRDFLMFPVETDGSHVSIRKQIASDPKCFSDVLAGLPECIGRISSDKTDQLLSKKLPDFVPPESNKICRAYELRSKVEYQLRELSALFAVAVIHSLEYLPSKLPTGWPKSFLGAVCHEKEDSEDTSHAKRFPDPDEILYCEDHITRTYDSILQLLLRDLRTRSFFAYAKKDFFERNDDGEWDQDRLVLAAIRETEDETLILVTSAFDQLLFSEA